MVGLRYKIFGNLSGWKLIRLPVNYTLPFLNLARTAENRISIATDVFSSVKDNKSSADNGSNSAIIGKGNTDFWTELDGNLKTILSAQFSAQRRGSKIAKLQPFIVRVAW